MQLTIKIEKRHLVFLAVIVCLIFVVGVYAFNSVPSNPAVFGHDDSEILNVSANKIVPGTFGIGPYTFPSNLTVSGDLVVLSGKNISLGGTSRGNWPSSSAQLPAANISSGTFGTNTGGGDDYIFPSDLNVTGVTRTNGGLVIEVRASDPPAGELYKGRIWLIG